MTLTLRKQVALVLGAATLIAAQASAAVARPAASSSSSSTTTTQQLRRDTAAIQALGISGVQARVIGPDGRQSVATAGTADVNTGGPVDPDGYFRMASTSKTLVATVLLQLEAEGRLSLDDKVERWLPERVQGKHLDGRRITLRDLLQHTSRIRDGLPGYNTPEEYEDQRYKVYSSDELVDDSLKVPGRRGWGYANTNYILAGMVIQKATGRPAHQEIEDRVLRPLGLDRTRWLGTSPTLPEPHARAYQFFDAEHRIDVTEQVPVDHEILSFVSTTRDENLLFRGLLSGRLLPAAQLAEMKATVEVSPDLTRMWGKGSGYGLGLVERRLTCGGTYWGHEGGDGGYITLNGVTADGRRSAVVSMSEALGDSPAHIEQQERAGSALIDHALCAGDAR
ncbi:serine hydrolase domain-containing protein [Kitasatospora sp. NPDC101183]|uniref:serine hydrolase domain-containing protein n=1 Tax=Kitasatospora sp. NPDC101183 TaxID=3364100 RepID=UPI0037FDBA1A